MKITNQKISRQRAGYRSELTGKVLKVGDKISIEGGLFLQIYNNKSVFRYKYRDSKGKQKQITIGMFSLEGDGINCFTLEQAMSTMLLAKNNLKNSGIDPKEEEENKKNQEIINANLEANTFGNYWPIWVEKKKFGNKAYNKKITDRFKKFCSTIEDIPLYKITEEKIRNILETILTLGPTYKDVAHRLRGSLYDLFNEAYREKLVTVNPLSRIFPDEYPAPQRGKFKHTTDLSMLKKILLAIDTYDTKEPAVGIGLKLFPHLFLRHSELRLLKWKDIDFDKRIWYLHKAKVKGQSIFEENIDDRPNDFCILLSDPVISLIKQLYIFTGHCEYAFSSRVTNKVLSDASMTKALNNILIANGIPHATVIHGFRNTARSLIPAKLGIPTRVIEQQMSHSDDNKKPGERAISSDKYGYDQYLYLSERRAMMDVWSEFLIGLKSIYIEITPEEAKRLTIMNAKTNWQVFLEELQKKYVTLARTYEQVKV